MNRSVVACVGGFVVATGVSCLLGTGVAAADDLVGQTYADAKSTLGDEGKTAKITTVLGDKESQDSCVVTFAAAAPFVGGTDGSHVSDTELLSLNCYAASASIMPGYSRADQAPDAQAVRDAEEQASAESEASVTTENER